MKRLDRLGSFAEKIDRLAREEIGVAIVGVYYEDEAAIEAGLGESKVLGYMLPLNLDNTSHLLLFKDGHMHITKPFSSKNHMINNKFIRDYKASFSSDVTSNYDLHVVQPRADILDDIKGVKDRMFGELEEVPDLGSSSERGEKFAQALDKGVRIGRILKVRRESGRDQRVERVLERMEVIFREDDEPPARNATSV